MPRRPRAVARVLERATGTARRHEMFTPGETVMVACSGGPDSLCLLFALSMLVRLFRIRLTVFHFDHRLRAGSDADARYVARQAERLRLPFVLREAVDAPASGQSIEAWARLARYAALAEAAREAGARRAALGHTRDDQAETVLLGLVRGGGLDAVAGMAPVTSLPPLGLPGARPLLETSRDEVLAFCRALRLRPRQDPMNADRRFLRARLRHDVLPLLEERLERGIRSTLARTAELVRADAAYLDAVASEAARRVAIVREDEVLLAASALATLPEPVGARVVQQSLRLLAAAAGEWRSDAEAVHVLGIVELARGRRGRRLALPGGLLAARAGEYVRLSRASPEGPAIRG